MADGSEAKQVSQVPTSRKTVKSAGGGKVKGAQKERVQLHIAGQVLQRLGVHAAMTGKNQSSIVESVLLSYLARYGAMKESFPAVKPDFLVEDVNPDAA